MRAVLPDPCLCLVTDRRLVDGTKLVERIVAAVTGGVDLVQLREKDLPGGKLLELAHQIKDAIGDSAMLMINERIDVAAAANADGVQLGEEALPTAVAREILGNSALIGRSVHSSEGATQAAQQGTDFLLVGSMFASRSHPGEEPTRPDLLRRIQGQCSLPMIGIGGIDASNAGQVIAAGAQGVAVISSILVSEDPKDAAYKIKQVLLAGIPAPRTN